MNKLLDYTEQVMNHHKNGKARGVELGFHSLKNLITFKPKYTTYILGFPRAGKTEIHLEILFNMTEKYSWKHALMSPEIGGVEDVIAELISKHLRKNFFKSSADYAASEKEIYEAMNHLSEYFYVLDNDDKDYDIDMFFDDCLKIETDNKIKLNTTSIDPWNDLEENLDKFGGREDKYLAAALRKVRAKAKKHDWHNFIVTHAKDMPSIELKGVTKEKIVCTAIPTLQSFAGGQVWSRRGFNVIGMWKPEKGAINKTTGIPFEDNEAMFKVLKTKPKGSGSLGFTYLYYDWKTNRYYENYEGEKCFAFDYLKVDDKIAKEKEIEDRIFQGEAIEIDF
jgi:hypothetical protein